MAALLDALRDYLPEGMPVPVRWLHAQRISSALVHRYVGRLARSPARTGLPAPRRAPVLARRSVGRPSSRPARPCGSPQCPGDSGAGPLSAARRGQPAAPLSARTYASVAGWMALRRDLAPGERGGRGRPGAFLAPSGLRQPWPELPVGRKLAPLPVSRATWPVYVSTPERAALELVAGLTRGDS